jgi:ribonuclease HI
MIKKNIIIYVDGACAGNPGPGGWGFTMSYNDHVKEEYGSEIYTTNNRMEITAAIKAIKAIKKESSITIYTDSVYVKNGITVWIHNWIKKNWNKNSKNPIKNIDLWQELWEAISIHSVEWVWVKGHNGNQGNERADYLANLGKNEAMRLANANNR